MTHLLKILPLLTALIASPAFATQADPHGGHHPAPTAETPKAPAPSAADAKPAMPGCPMMDGKAPADAMPMAMGGKGPDGKMMDGKAMQCMPPADKDADTAHDHPVPAPK